MRIHWTLAALTLPVALAACANNNRSVALAPVAPHRVAPTAPATGSLAVDKSQTAYESGLSARDARAVQGATTVRRDAHDPNIVLEGPLILQTGQTDGPHYALRAFLPVADPSKPKAVQLVVAAYSSEWLHLHSAHSYGRPVKLIPISKQVISCHGGCLITESVGLMLSIDELRAAAAGKGYSVKVSGSVGAVVVDVPAPYAQGFLQKVAEQTKGPAPAPLTTGSTPVRATN